MTDTALPSKLSSKELIFCNQCKGETNHICQREYLRERSYGGSAEWDETWYRLWICAGCEDATLEICYINSGYGAPEYYDSTYYPKRTEYEVTRKRFIQLPEKLSRIYHEAIEAFNNGLNVLCAAGLRALLEGICENKRVRGRNLATKIDALADILPENIVVSLHSFRFIGNAALHELTPPTNDTLRLAIEVVEDLLNFLYELDYKARRLDRYRKTGSTTMPPPSPLKGENGSSGGQQSEECVLPMSCSVK